MNKVLPAGLAMLCAGFVLSSPVSVAAQNPQEPGGTVALEGTVDKEYRAANVIVVNTVDGVKHAFEFTKDLLIHGGRSSGPDALGGLIEGTTVVVHYTVSGGIESAQEIDRVDDAGVEKTEGVVTGIDRGRKQIKIRFDSGRTETFRLTDRAAADAGKDLDQGGTGLTKVVVYYTDESGQKVAHYFKKIS